MHHQFYLIFSVQMPNWCIRVFSRPCWKQSDLSCHYRVCLLVCGQFQKYPTGGSSVLKFQKYSAGGSDFKYWHKMTPLFACGQKAESLINHECNYSQTYHEWLLMRGPVKVPYCCRLYLRLGDTKSIKSIVQPIAAVHPDCPHST